MTRPSERERETVRQRAGGRCEYCRYPLAFYCDEHLELDHVYPSSQGGPDVLANYAYACPGCNVRKLNKTEAVDPAAENAVRLFDPRRDEWSHHFCWGGDKMATVVGLTATGRATVSALKLNRSPLEEIRKTLFDQGLHPPDQTRSP